jgi:hypothetical protein
MWRYVALVVNDVSEEHIASIIRVYRSVIDFLFTAIVPSSLIVSPWRRRRYVPPKRPFLQATRHRISEDAILHSHSSENIKSYKPIWSLRPFLCIMKTFLDLLISTVKLLDVYLRHLIVSIHRGHIPWGQCNRLQITNRNILSEPI